MRLGRVATPAGVVFVVIEGDGDDAVAKEIAEQYLSRNPTFTGRSWPMADVRLLAPILASKVICMGKNYAAHAREMGGEAPEDPVIFLKPNTAIIGPGVPIQLPHDANPVHHEGELAIVIERPCKDVPADRAAQYILGYTIANDVSARDLQKRDGSFSGAKSFDTFCPLGPAILVDPEWERLEVRTRVNGAERQHGRVGEMVFGFAELLAYASCRMTLEPGDLFLTGTPSGVGPLADGDRIEIEIPGVGILANPVEALRQ